MLNQQPALDAAFQALADPTRRAIVERLARGPAPVSELARPLVMSLPAVLQHLAVLERSGLIRSEKAGRVRTCQIVPAALGEVERWIGARRAEWEQRMDRLGTFLAEHSTPETTMDQQADATIVQPPPLTISRVFRAPRSVVYAAWTSAEQVKRWFSPAIFTTPDAVVEPRVGGRFEVCMRAPDGADNWARGTFADIVADRRLVIDMYAVDAAGARLFRAYTEVDFSDEPNSTTRVDIVQTYTLFVPQAIHMIGGAPQGWSQTLDKLEAALGSGGALT